MNHVGKGGASLALFDLVSEIKRIYPDQIDVIVVTGKRNELNGLLDGIGIRNFAAPYKNFLSSYRSPIWFWRSLVVLRYWLLKPIAKLILEKRIDFSKIDIIHSNLDRIDIGVYFAKKYRIPHVWHVRENATGGFRLMSVFNNPIKHMLQYDSTFVTISKSVTYNWMSLGIPQRSIRMVYDGIRLESFDDFIPHRIEGKCKFVFLGGYAESKGQFRFVKALLKLPKEYKQRLQVDFYGNGNHKYIDSINCFIRKNGLDEVVKLYDYDRNIYSKLKDYHIGLNCSTNEGFGRVTVEYMMAGLCPFVSNSGANTEIVSDKVCGVVYNLESELDLIEKLKYVLNNPKDIYQFAVNARERSISNFSMNTHANKIVELYKDLMENENKHHNTCI